MVRKVRSVERRPFGMVVKLDCGHQKWMAGADRTVPARTECLQSPCYRPARFMGQ